MGLYERKQRMKYDDLCSGSSCRYLPSDFFLRLVPRRRGRGMGERAIRFEAAKVDVADVDTEPSMKEVSNDEELDSPGRCSCLRVYVERLYFPIREVRGPGKTGSLGMRARSWDGLEPTLLRAFAGASGSLHGSARVRSRD